MESPTGVPLNCFMCGKQISLGWVEINGVKLCPICANKYTENNQPIVQVNATINPTIIFPSEEEINYKLTESLPLRTRISAKLAIDWYKQRIKELNNL
jgi:hypothetical protein